MTNHELLIDLLHQVNRKLGEKGREVIAQHKFPITTMLIVKQINLEPGITISELARKTNIAKSHISNIVKDLSVQGWVEKHNDVRDQRVLRLFLSPAGTEHLGFIGREVRQQFAQLLAPITDSRATQIIEALQEILTALEITQAKEYPLD
ncbi:MAG: MarR family winged helix-turn-helix transcriptional regulator [Syntrophomonadaceae bacterium]|nr:MarR family winged helix-turn-helix transcriptional regulator [Syntrophomonadaceae bacterium]